MPPAVIAAGIVAGGAVVGGVVQAKGAKKAAKTQAEAAQAGITAQERARLAFEERAEPFRQLGVTGAEQLTSFLQDPTQQLAEINPVVDFLRQQGFEQIQESAAAQGRLGAGGTLQDLTQFNTQLASTIVPQLQNQRFNQLFNVAGLGANVAGGVGTAGLQAAGNIGNLLSAAGQAQAQGQIGQTQAITGGIQNLAGVAGAFPNLFGGGQQGQQIGITPVPQTAGGAQSFGVAPPPQITGQPLPPVTSAFGT